METRTQTKKNTEITSVSEVGEDRTLLARNASRLLDVLTKLSLSTHMQGNITGASLSHPDNPRTAGVYAISNEFDIFLMLFSRKTQHETQGADQETPSMHEQTR